METPKGSIKVTPELSEKILDRKTFQISSSQKFQISEIVNIVDETNNETICEILIIDKKGYKNGSDYEKWLYNFLIYSTEEEKKILEKRLKALGYL